VRITGPTPVGPSTRIELAEFRIAIESVLATEGVPPLPPPPVVEAPPPPPPISAVEAVPPGGMRLVAEGGPYDGRVFTLPPGVITVGRAVDNDLVFDDPSLSRKHARIHRDGNRLEVEDLGSSNGSFVNGRRVGGGAAGAGDVIRFGDLSFRCEGGEYGSTRSVDPGLGRLQFWGLIGGAGATFLLLVLAVVFLVRKVPPVQASGREAIAKLTKQADGHLQAGRKLYEQRRYADAKAELDQALELDPANPDARKLQRLAVRGPDDEKAMTAATAALTIGDRKGLEQVLHAWDEMIDGAPAKLTLAGKLSPALQRYGETACARREYGECAWALCRAFETAPADKRPEKAVALRLHDVERRLKRDKTYQPCRATP
jgi:hypothetical protein